MIIRLGITGQMIDLEKKSLSLPSTELIDSSAVSLSANKTRHKDYAPVKQIKTLSYEIVSKEYYDTRQGLYNLQLSSLEDLTYEIEEASGLKSYKVQMNPVSHGMDLGVRPFYQNINIELHEV